MCAWYQKFSDIFFGNKEDKPADTPAPTAGRPRRVTIGLDFGTSTSKCCFREASDGKPFVFVSFRRPGDQGSSPLFDTAVSTRARALVFGPDAANATSVVRSFKMCLPCQAAMESRSAQLGPCPRCDSTAPGTFQLAGEKVSAEDLCTLHLSVILSEVLPLIPKVIGVDSSRLRISVNAAAPLQQLKEFGPVGPYFERAVFYALRIAEAGVARRCWPIADAMNALQMVRKEPLPAESLSPTALFPETHAAMTGYMLLPESEKGLHGLLDVGAGTTDVSFFWFQKDPNATKAWYYSTGTMPKGMDDVDRLLAPVLKVPPHRLRSERESKNPEWLAENGHIFKDLSWSVRKHLGEIYLEAKKVDQRTWAWVDKEKGVAQCRLFLVGGGAACAPLVEISSKKPLEGNIWKYVPLRLLVPSTESVVAPNGSIQALGKAGFDDARPLLLLAYGLAHPRPDVPKFIRDSEGVVYIKSEREPLTHDDLY